jgi:anti-sigma regulatory factor (Ser/Thr protein kinase)/anti-anti-sigma regulatory factor
MIWSRFRPRGEGIVLLPHRLTHETMHPFIDLALDEQGMPRYDVVRFDFSRITFIDPTGVVVVSNLIDYLREGGVKVKFRGLQEPYSDAITYLDDCAFFRHYAGKPLRIHAALRNTTVPLERVKSAEKYSYLNNKLMPWIAARVGLEQDSVDAVRVCIEEIFHNIDDHAGVKVGCALAQFFPKNDHIQVAISDFGVGIPAVVRSVLPKISDSGALLKACEEGFTTKTNVRNRGAGLATLMRYVTLSNEGTVQLISGRAEVVANQDFGKTKLRSRVAKGIYPGTLVRLILRTDRFEAMEADVQPEPFKW